MTIRCYLQRNIIEILQGKFSLIKEERQDRGDGLISFEVQAVRPLVTTAIDPENDEDFVKNLNVITSDATNLAAIHWDDFEQFIRKLFTKYFVTKLNLKDDEFTATVTKVGNDDHAGDRGIDIVIQDRRPIFNQSWIVQVKVKRLP